MPDSIFGLDAGFPQFTGTEPLKQKVDMMYDYMVQLQESLRYTMQNLDSSNFNATGLVRLGETITQPVKMKLKDVEENTLLLWVTADELAAEMSSVEGKVTAVSQTVNGISLSVSNGDTASSIKLVVGDNEIEQKIEMTGLVTFAALKGNGTTVINGSNITTGKITAIEIESCTWTSKGDDTCGVKIQGSSQTFLYGESIGAELYMSPLGTFWMGTANNYELHINSAAKMKLTAQGNASLDAKGAIYIGTTTGYTTPVQIGNGSSEIRLYGNVYVNDVLLGS